MQWTEQLFTYGVGWPGDRPDSYVDARPGYPKLDGFGRIVEEYQRSGAGVLYSLVARYLYNTEGDLAKYDNSSRPFTYGIL